ncbi:MAG TPA: hypothetical protein VGA53_02365 [Candidatus Paceibacterota bacterium]
MPKLTKVEKSQRRQTQLMRRSEKEKARRKRNVYLRNVARHAKAKK